MAGRTILETERLLLREHDEGDAVAFYAFGSDPDVIRYLNVPPLTGIDHAREILLAHPIADYRKYGFGRWACLLKESGAMIGFAGLKYLEDLREVDVGYAFRPAYWGRGLATEVGRASIDYGFAQLRLERILGLVDPRNAASARVLEKLGLTHRGEVVYRGETVARYVLEAPRGGEG